MTNDTSWSWDEMLEEFHRLGGAAENLRPGASNGGTGPRLGGERGLYPINPGEKIRLYVPPKLLVPAEDVRIENDQLVLAPETSVEPAVKSFFERFEANFGFGAGAGARSRQFLIELAGLPDAVKAHLRPFMPRALDVSGPPSDDWVLRQFLRGRVVEFSGKQVLPTLPSMINHGPEQAAFDLTQGLRYIGTFEGEVLARLRDSDSWDLFLSLGIAAPQISAFSLPVECRPRTGQPIRINRNIAAVQLVDGMPAPKVDVRPESFGLSHVLTGHRRASALPRAVFRRIVRDHNIVEPDEAFDLICHINRTWFIELVRLLETAEGALATGMRAAALHQLDSMSWAIGANLRAEAPPPQSATPLN